ncbi:NADH dehydrogenase [ubiquinone] 1 alpha subcomplex assembly factor 4 [Takifugu flavidus]|uniref:NADH dehydrogenase [ubiquinone] 1 alpha subcomplex assembly factor 4 n=1 Tax=Takifugu flavidus TaxID=433684 RepID=A0A5C6NQ48_9TELE|nr:NADH dehydrogenase [ubiquinone] 1 alpha subcomplex assembly factor 4 [Takifugu flavidus]TWW68250.1 alpha subcomplex assembly factor 4 [Takifugu flavidus]
MGARIARVFRNFNLENRVHREISREKPISAPQHPVNTATSAELPNAEAMSGKNEPLLKLLQSVYVESTDPAAAAHISPNSQNIHHQTATPTEMVQGEQSQRRPLKFHLPGSIYGLEDLKDVPKGKLTIGEALKALSSHQREPKIGTAEKIAQDYCLDLKDTKALLEFFIPFQVHIIPPKSEKPRQIKSS